MIHATQLKHNRATYEDVYLFLNLYLNGPGIAQAEAIIYIDQTIKNPIAKMILPNYSFDTLGQDPLDTLHTLTIADLENDNPTATFTVVDPILT